ncbi:hypothetical protein E2C01_068470 [Portunus trituberculatus]
MAGCV